MSDHALLSASGAHKWLHCTPSARLEEKLPESESSFANEGRLAHEIAELKLRKQFVEPMGPRAFSSRLKKLQDHPLYQFEMLQHTDSYLDYVQGIVHQYPSPPYVAVEKKLDFSDYVPEAFGTGDCVILHGSTLHVIDLKYGKGVPVSPEQNPQMMLYALGAYSAYAILYPIETVKLAIVQPRISEPQEWEIPLPDLLAWGESIKPIAQRAFAGEGDFNPGGHCRFCRAKALCRVRAEFNTALESYNYQKPPLLSNGEIGGILEKAKQLAKWAKDLEDYALSECLAGNDIAGWKAVEGRGSRGYVDQDAAFSALIKAGYDEALLYQRVPLTVPNVEKLLGKAKYNELLASANLVKTEAGKPTLAPTSDKREAITRQSAADIFKNEGRNE